MNGQGRNDDVRLNRRPTDRGTSLSNICSENRMETRAALREKQKSLSSDFTDESEERLL